LRGASSQKVSKNQKIIAFIVACPKSQNSIYGTHSPLGIKNLYHTNTIRWELMRIKETASKNIYVKVEHSHVAFQKIAMWPPSLGGYHLFYCA
jgi:hypothetical protein